jgi:hypothetical protein
MAAVVEDLVDRETLEQLRATADELDRSTGLPPPGALSGVTTRSGAAAPGSALLALRVSVVVLAGVAALTLGTVIAFVVLIVGLAAIARVSGR